jgi:hypothetical protein
MFEKRCLWPIVAFLLVFNDNIGTDSAAPAPDGFQTRPAWLSYRVQIFKNSICRRFEENAFIPVGVQVELHRLQFDAQLIRHVTENNRRIIRMPSHGASGCKLLLNMLDCIIAARVRIGKGLDLHRRTISASRLEKFNPWFSGNSSN